MDTNEMPTNKNYKGDDLMLQLEIANLEYDLKKSREQAASTGNLTAADAVCGGFVAACILFCVVVGPILLLWLVATSS